MVQTQLLRPWRARAAARARRLAALTAAAAALILPLRLTAQVDVPSLKWRTYETANFRIHFEPQLEPWARHVAERMESVRRAVAGRVGYTYPHKIDILVEDPLNVPNGSAWPALTGPSMRFWATPPSPTSVIGNSRGWGEILSVHEYAHLAHLLRPSRQPLSLPIAISSVVPVSPMVTVPAWVTEGYATVIEGELTGSGRPNGALRPAIIRSLALEGYLPAYAQLDATNRFNGGAMRYLVGSAYLQWLQAQRGDSSLPQLWRRITARNKRAFPAAFAETFGDAPDNLYGRWVAEVTAKAFAARAHLEQQGLAQGTLVQRWALGVGSPDISPDGQRVAVRRASATDAGAIHIYRLAPDTVAARKDSTKWAKRLARDAEDVAPYRAYPRALRRVATLGPVGGEPFDAPRFLPDGERLLVTRSVPLADGRRRSDLFEWNSKTGRVRRITKGAGIQQADPTPDGKSAIAVTCGGGVCSLLHVDLASGATRPLATGTLDASYAGVRVSPNGRAVATARQQGTRWVPMIIDIASGDARSVGPNDEASRFSPVWENDSTLLVVSEASGGWEIERHAPGGSVSVAVRTLGAAGSPEVGPDGRIWWLDLHGRGWDLRVNDAGTSLALGTALDAAQFPATKRVDATLATDFAPQTLGPARRYGRGPLNAAVLLAGTGGLIDAGADGASSAFGFSFGDPIGRATGFAYGGGGTDGAWSGARAAFTWRGFRPSLQLQGFLADYRPSEHRSALPIFEQFDQRLTGAMFASDLTRHGVHGSVTTRIGVSVAQSENPTLGDTDDRQMAFAQLGGRYMFTPKPARQLSVQWQANAALGTTADVDWTRTVVDARVGFMANGGGLALRARGGEINADAPAIEQFVVGGSPSIFVDEALVTQRVDYLGLPFLTTGGRRFGILTAETQGPLRIFHDWIVAGDDDFGETLRTVGGEFTLDVPRLSVFRLPPVKLRFGVVHSLNGRFRNETQGYSGLTIQP